jgi:hypothetical protein
VASLRAQVSRASLAAKEVAIAGAGTHKTDEHQSALEADMRIRAFRQHLKEIHQNETEVRNQNRLSARLSRLWSRTAPK